MIRSLNRSLRNRKGFTLIELIVVIAILAILAAVAIPKFVGVTANATTKADQANIAICESAAQLYLANQSDTSATNVNSNNNTDTAASNTFASYLKLPILQPGTTDKGYIITIASGVVTVTKE